MALLQEEDPAGAICAQYASDWALLSTPNAQQHTQVFVVPSNPDEGHRGAADEADLLGAGDPPPEDTWHTLGAPSTEVALPGANQTALHITPNGTADVVMSIPVHNAFPGGKATPKRAKAPGRGKRGQAEGVDATAAQPPPPAACLPTCVEAGGGAGVGRGMVGPPDVGNETTGQAAEPKGKGKAKPGTHLEKVPTGGRPKFLT